MISLSAYARGYFYQHILSFTRTHDGNSLKAFFIETSTCHGTNTKGFSGRDVVNPLFLFSCSVLITNRIIGTWDLFLVKMLYSILIFAYANVIRNCTLPSLLQKLDIEVDPREIVQGLVYYTRFASLYTQSLRTTIKFLHSFVAFWSYWTKTVSHGFAASRSSVWKGEKLTPLR